MLDITNNSYAVILELTGEQIFDMLDLALEGTSGWTSDVQEDNLGPRPITFTDTEDGKRHTLDEKAITKGVEAFAEHCPAALAGVIAGLPDQTTANLRASDLFLQCCVFGEVIYG